MGYYEATHPVFERMKMEAFAALSEVFRAQSIVTFGSGGRQLLMDAEGTVLADATAADVAQRMFILSIVALRFHDSATADDLGLLLKLLSESPERVRAAGGARSCLTGMRGIDVLEVDFAALFAGQGADLGPLVDGDPIAELALKAVLRFKEEDDDRSEALAINLDRLSTPSSLGELLDELLDSAEPGVVHDARDEWGSLSGDDFADVAAQAYLANQQQLAGRTEELAESARILSNTLVRLSPETRFALLRQLAGKSSVEIPAVEQLGKHVRDEVILEAIASALIGTSDSDTARAIGNLIRRIRPVEAERHRLLERVDARMIEHKKSIDGMLWQHIQSQANQDRALGLLEINLAKRKRGMILEAQRRMRGQLLPVVGQDILFGFDRLAVAHRAARAMASLVGQPGRLAAGLVAAARAMVGALVEQDDEASLLEVLDALVRRFDRDRDPQLADAVQELLAGERGAIWSAKLLSRGVSGGRLIGELILNALDGALDREAQEALIERLARVDREVLLDLGKRAAAADPVRVHHLVSAALRADAKIGVKIARMALRNERTRAKELALKALIDAPGAETLGLLAQVAGWKGDKHARALLGLKSGDKLHLLQLSAIGALGLSRSPAAVAPLVDLLTQKRMLESKEVEEIRSAAAQALWTNETQEARRALEAGARHAKKSVRDVCTRVLAKRSR